MERTLSLVLDEFGYKSLTLLSGSSLDIDSFTTTFDDSEHIRDRFKDKIDKYLEENKAYLDSLNKNYRGRIVVLELVKKDNELIYVPKRVLYKKHIKAFDQMVKNEATMHEFLKLERINANEAKITKSISSFVRYKIMYANFQVKSQVNLIRNEIKRDKNNFYDNLRLIAKAYEAICKKNKNLKTIDQIYDEYKSSLPKRKQNMKDEFISTRTSRDYDDSITRIGDFTYEPEDMPSLDELDRIDPNTLDGIIPDGLGRRQ